MMLTLRMPTSKIYFSYNKKWFEKPWKITQADNFETPSFLYFSRKKSDIWVFCVDNVPNWVTRKTIPGGTKPHNIYFIARNSKNEPRENIYWAPGNLTKRPKHF